MTTSDSRTTSGTMTTSGTIEFTHAVTSDGPAHGMTFSGRRPAESGPVAADTPLVIALHGGTYTSVYFDVPGYSLLERASSLGIPILAIDRPSYGSSSRVDDSDSIILENAAVLDHLIGELWDAFGAGAAGIVLIGHSIGGAVTTALAARHPSWPLLGIAVSGCLLQVPPESGGAWAALPELYLVELPGEVKDFVMFGPDWTYGEAMPAASHVADSPVPKTELLDITSTWIDRVRATAAQVTVPVHSRQGEFDRLWITDAQQVADFGAIFSAAPLVDASLVRHAGHCIDFHRSSRAFQLEQLAFALACCIRPDGATA
jgi:pimeloyl-ACP methyl ester carboxylesterase